ncbi:ATP-binding protein [Streptomyces albireticuli]|uniref:ATP-binding protein n=1 Tax=Streptomyces albireticuli TaxID=1940 RepID=UPI000D1B8C89|nr:NB-ARC domain-containing protein [Streptomyces albireticuli]MCD9143269.1 NB-ARC domain-containing protein [Streptomyces albireticuli]MCD9163711.1 NB-ARC domain-containing protein [Streptomyces albireticuli]MCD9191386.1 NB-ARC domain-containing protein [Streptomyces albireticuli]
MSPHSGSAFPPSSQFPPRPGSASHGATPGSGRFAPPGNLPAEPGRFVGRAEELAALADELARSRVVTVTGVGGVGKTRLAGRVAREVQYRFCDGAWLAELSTLTDPALLDHAIAGALGLTDHTDRPPRACLLKQLADRRLLLVLDGCEHLVEECAPLVRELLRRAPRLRVLVTSRRPLEIAGEQVFPLRPMTEPEAAALFEDRAAAAWPSSLRPRSARAEPGAVAELCRRLDGIPLALELAAARLGALSVTQVLERLDDRFRLLTGGARGELPRHQTLRTTIGWSHELCTPAERLLWARLTVFAGLFDLEAAEYVCSGPELPAEDLPLVLAELVAQSVVVREDTPPGPRYRLLDSVRMYGAGWLDALADSERMRRRHRDWYMGLATWCELDWFSPRQAEVAAMVDAELPNLRLAMEHSLQDSAEAHIGQYLAGTLWFCWVGCGRLAEGRYWLDRAVAVPADNPATEETRLKALWVLGYVAVLQGDPAGAVAALDECRRTAERTGNARALAYAEHRTGCLALVSDDMPRAEALLRGALARYEEIGELNSNVLMGKVELAMAVAFRGDLADAVRLCEEVRDVCEEHGERWTLAYALYVLGFAAFGGGDGVRARALLEECLAIDHAFHDLVGSVLALELLALITLEGDGGAHEGDAVEAAVLQGAAGRLWRSVGLPLFGSRYFNGPHALCERRLRDRLGARRYENHVREGARLDLDAVTARALRGPRPDHESLPDRGRVPGARTRSRSPETHRPAGSPVTGTGETAG